jgi:hypothetical protein
MKFDEKQFDVEHALGMYATSFVTIPAESIYDPEALKQFEAILATCHIYIIGLTPKLDFVGAKQEGTNLITSFKVAGETKEVHWPLPPELPSNTKMRPGI